MPRGFPALYWGRAGGFGFTPFGTLYGGLILRCGLDGKLYCINPETGAELWSSKVGQRLFGSPIAIGEDLFVANDQGSLYQLDFANGSIMKQATISGPVLGAMATDNKNLFFITDDGLLHSVNVSNLQERWKTPVAVYTDSTPAVDAGIIYLADQKGTAMAVNVSDGKVRWSTELGDEFTRCPVVGKTHILFGCRGGTLACLNRADGKILWKKNVKSRFHHEPMIIGDEALYVELKSNGEKSYWFLMLAKLSSGESRHLQTSVKKGEKYENADIGFGNDPVLPLSYYKGSLFLVNRHGDSGHIDYRVNYAWHPVGGNFYVIRPMIEEAVKK
jgi:outer membrane protein assembly factor BamB